MLFTILHRILYPWLSGKITYFNFISTKANPNRLEMNNITATRMRNYDHIFFLCQTLSSRRNILKNSQNYPESTPKWWSPFWQIDWSKKKVHLMKNGLKFSDRPQAQSEPCQTSKLENFALRWLLAVNSFC